MKYFTITTACILNAGGGPKSVLRAYESLSQIASEAGLQAPHKITSVQLRKYMATISQVLDMTPSQEKWLFTHLGHTENVHMQHYRARSDVIERIEVAKICLIQDLNRVHEFVGKKIGEIQFDGMYMFHSLPIDNYEVLF